MSVGWNFERRRDTCTRFLIGVSLLAKGLPDRDTNLEKVRSQMRLSPEEALFAARRLDEEKLLAFDAGGAVRSNARGIERAEALMNAVRAKAQRYDDVARTLRAAGTPLDVLAAVIRADGESLACGAPDSEPDATYRVALVDDVVTLERRRADGAFEAAPLD
jgi:hypothetical protein